MRIVTGEALAFPERIVHHDPAGLQLGFIVALITKGGSLFRDGKRGFALGWVVATVTSLFGHRFVRAGLEKLSLH
jgi:hypothetical protein